MVILPAVVVDVLEMEVLEELVVLVVVEMEQPDFLFLGEMLQPTLEVVEAEEGLKVEWVILLEDQVDPVSSSFVT